MNGKTILLVLLLIGCINTIQSQQIKKVKIEEVVK